MEKAQTPNIKRTARITGLLYLLLIPVSVFGMIYVPSTLIVPGNLAATAANISVHEPLFRLGMVSVLLTQLLNIAVVLWMYQVLKAAGQGLARLMVIFSLLAVPITMVGELSHAGALLAVEAGQPLSEIGLFLGLHEYGTQIAGLFFGLWLLPMGYLVFKSGYMPKLIGALLMVACAGYLADSFIFLLALPVGFKFSDFTFLGEVAMTLYLLIRGVNVKQWEKRAL